MESPIKNTSGKRPGRYAREKLESVTKKTEEDLLIIEALEKDGTDAALDFLDYWQRAKRAWDEAVDLLKLVMSGETPVSNEVIDDCRKACLCLSQILHVLLELRESSSGSRTTKSVMTTITRRAYDDRQEARKSLDTLTLWQREAGLVSRRDIE